MSACNNDPADSGQAEYAEVYTPRPAARIMYRQQQEAQAHADNGDALQNTQRAWIE